ncbi:ABC-type transport system periplasmic substrate-binding protein (probable substrate zinc) [Natrialba magadii ATCC 43099]|uniref:ABC-type transport system periplasmic substrate-binding protein (Probable substrate zinc) n=1 Tax=Natrialba magadii (strain ATCC 43099 / DSM 3394 / CCM 3739 / CIP 104546 / IAM 13178 / JCM 8861 / NBRC 102185 / NCIMB 2190 / MS3) TaxID=547559 RepID=D3SVG8_NATMM|nr:metal ABC transporter substrate-binding protein [Natrialba magadii]ADD05576.1 ABC-type transport system periplasmic substrate-binding protein (probable substrate zinc) [Natrialba magadii ATCC 43099]ELY30009.1 metal ABC transporter substrate-binding protein [Natrialba magadii ATCC 43099]
MDVTRRSVLKRTLGGAALGALAGCLNEPDETSGTDGGYASFFALWDWATQIAGDEMVFENPVDTGEMGHGWEPDGNLVPEIASSEVFLYLDTPEFAWAQDIVADLERDYEDEIVVVDGLEGMDPYLIPFDGDSESLPEPDHEHGFDPESISRDLFDFYDLRSNDQLGYWHIDHWHGGVPDVPVDDSVPISAAFRDQEERVVPLGPNEEFQFDARLADTAPTDVLDIASHGDSVELIGLETGETEIIFQLRHDGELVYETDAAPMSVDVVAEVDEAGAGVFHDPHVWVDPVLASRVVDTIADGLAEVDPENAELFAENAAAYKERLDEVDQQFEALVENAERDVAVFVAHDSYRYVERRYGFELHTPVGVAPDAAESLEDISDMIDIVEKHDIDTILYDPFETPGEDVLPTAAEMLIENSSATDAEPLSPAEGTTHEWAEQEWGWVEQMEEVNIPSLEKALGAE